MAQEITVMLIVALAIGYIIYRTYRTMHDAQSGCYGCKGCALKEQMMKNRKHRKHTYATRNDGEQCSNFRRKTAEKPQRGK